MPIELTRRDVVKAGLLGAVGTAAGWSGCAPATYTVGPGRASRPAHHRVLVMADTHIAEDPSTLSRAGVEMAMRLASVLDDAMPVVGHGGHAFQQDGPIRSLDFDFALINGDSAYDIGTQGDYRMLVAGLSPLMDFGLPVHVLLGNHDDRMNFRAVLNAPPSDLEIKHVRKLGVEDGSSYCDWLLLDSLRVVDEVPGELEGAQLMWFNEKLREDADRPAIIVVHHPPVPDDEPDRPFALQDHVAFWALIESHPRVKAVLHGHTHRWEPRLRRLGARSSQRRDVMMIGLPPTSYVFDEANPWGYVVADVDAAGVSFTLRAMDGHAADGESVRVAF
ncbi:MAG: metallophosphoesterase [Planctomycetota bacterium]